MSAYVEDEVTDQIHCFSARPDGDGRVDVRPDSGSIFDVMKNALGLKELRIVETGGKAWRRNASNGTAATMSSRCRQGSWWATTAIRTQTRCCERRASR